LQKAKHLEQRISTVRGIRIDRSDGCQNAPDSIRLNRELDSKEMDLSDAHREKQNAQRFSISGGMIIEGELEKL
jgi:hypothetical protein